MTLHEQLTALPTRHDIRTGEQTVVMPVALHNDALAAVEERDRLREAVEESRYGWENVLELGLLPERYRDGAVKLERNARQALAGKP